MNDIKASGFPVIVHPTMERAGGDTESLSIEDAAKLKAAGIPFAMQSGYEGYVPKTRVVLFEAAMAAANGLSQRTPSPPSPSTPPDYSASTTASARLRSEKTPTWRCMTATHSNGRHTAPALSSTAGS